MIAIDVITNLRDLEALREDWQQLLDDTEATTPFQLPDWQLTWWHHFGSGQLRVFAFRERGRLIGVVPCFLHQWSGRNQLTLIGSGISDYLEPAIAPQYATQIVSLLNDWLAAIKEWDVCDWQDLNAGSPLARLHGSGLHIQTREDAPCSAVCLTGTFEQFWSARSKDLRRNVKRYGARADEAGPVEFEIIQNPDSNVLESLIELHAARWQARGESGTIAANSAAVFLRNISRRMADAGMLRIFILRFRGQPTALNLGFLFRGTYFAYISAFDPQHEYFGFGRMLLFRSIQFCYVNGIASWNFLRGDEPYKLSWGAKMTAKIRVFAERRIG